MKDGICKRTVSDLVKFELKVQEKSVGLFSNQSVFSRISRPSRVLKSSNEKENVGERHKSKWRRN